MSSVAFLETRDSFLTYPLFSRRLLISGRILTRISPSFLVTIQTRQNSLVWNRFYPSFDTFDVTETLQIGAKFFFSFYEFSTLFINFRAPLVAIKPRISSISNISNFFKKIMKWSLILYLSSWNYVFEWLIFKIKLLYIIFRKILCKFYYSLRNLNIFLSFYYFLFSIP